MVSMKKQDSVLNVFMNGLIIGKLAKMARGGLTFVYDSSWLATPGSRPLSLSLPLVRQAFSGDIVYNFFDNLLPENPQIRARIQAKFQIGTSQPFDLLARIGRDCVGAIQLLPENESSFAREIAFENLTEKQMAILLRNYQKNPLGMTEESADFRISIAGVQEKSAFLLHKNKWARPVGTTPTSHIFKLPIGLVPQQNIDLTDSCENEWLCAKITAAFGLPVANCEVLHFEDIKVLAVERFDRRLASDKSWLMRLPQEDMCQALGISPNLKYQADAGPGIHEIMDLLLGSTQSMEDRDQFFSTQVLFWLLAAIDGHAKNFSLFIEPEGRYRLTPLYDIMSVYPLLANKQLQKQKVKMAMGLKGKNMHYHWHDLQRRHFLDTAKAVNYPVERAASIIDEMLEKVDTVIEEVSAQLPKRFPTKIAEPIFTGMRFVKRKLKS